MLFLLLSFLGAQSFPQQKPFLFGVQTHFVRSPYNTADSLKMARELDSVKSAGFKLIRDECLWNDVEKIKGVFSFPKYADDYVTAARKRGMKILMILDYNNPLYADKITSGITTDENRTAFVRYCQKMVQRYSPMGVKYYEIWNEPNVPPFWSPNPDAEAYTELLKAVYPAIKKTDPGITVLACSTSPAEGNPEPFIPWLAFIKTIVSSGGLKYMDGISVHPYSVDKNPDDCFLNDISRLQAVIGEKMPVWITEIGYPTTKVWPYVSEQQQAANITKLILLGRTSGQLKLMNFYDFKNDGTDPENDEHNFGLVNHDLTPKPVFNACKIINSLIYDKPLISKSIDGPLHKLVFGSSSGRVYAVWNSSGHTIKTEKFRTKCLKVISHLGDISYLYDKDKKPDVEYKAEPGFITEIDALPAISRIEINSLSDTLRSGEKAGYSVTAYTHRNEKINVSCSSVKWRFSNSSGKMASSGRLAAEKEGEGTITATFKGKKALRSITILSSSK
ncbi:MAG: cellulase family glycosylhydrolase [Syntrophothermus sp.]